MDPRLCVTCACLLTMLSTLSGRGQEDCPAGRWQCDDGRCVRAELRCDGQGDCLDGSDEMSCPSDSSSCPRGHFPCVDSVGCVNASSRCDGRVQCPTGSDEEDCPPVAGCLESDWTCGNHMCVPKGLRCNGQNDCTDNSDEQACGLCERGLRCPDGSCLASELRCDGKVQCFDGSDEPVTCGRLCAVDNGGCSHVCVDRPGGPQCSCPVGLKLSANGAACEDVDECASAAPPCVHHCLNTVGSFYCHCRDGFSLQGRDTCVLSDKSTRLLTVRTKALGLLNVTSAHFEVIQTLESEPVALTFDLARGWFYWADGNGSIYKSDGARSRTTHSGEPGIRSLACDWLNGNLFWTNPKTGTINMLAVDGRSSTSVLSRSGRPSELVLVPVESLMFWMSAGPGERETLDRSWMDGSERRAVSVLTAQSAHSLTSDVPSRRLYWISDFKSVLQGQDVFMPFVQSVEAVGMDGTGRVSITGLFNQWPALGLAVLGSSFYWVDGKGLWQVLQNQQSPKNFISKAPLPLLEVYHELQQPKALSACKGSPCQFCQLTKANPAGFICACPSSKVLLLNGKCEYPRFLYSTVTDVALLEWSGAGLSQTQLFKTSQGIGSFDVDWYRDLLYWTNRTGSIQRTSFPRINMDAIAAPLPVCSLTVDQRSGRLYFLSCDQHAIGTVNGAGGVWRWLYRSTSRIQNLQLDWLRGVAFWLEDERLLHMSTSAGRAEELLRMAGRPWGHVALDLRANSLLWNTKESGLTAMSLLQERQHHAGRRWNVSGSVVAAFEPYLLSVDDAALTLWDRRDGSRVGAATLTDPVLKGIPVLWSIHTGGAPPPCTKPSLLCRHSSVCVSRLQQCDGQSDCPEGDDEEFCAGRCSSENDFRCKDGRSCISSGLVCDGVAHCVDASDEADCPTRQLNIRGADVLKCRFGSVPCKDGSGCVLYSHVCDGQRDCADGSDELECDAPQNALNVRKLHGSPSEGGTKASPPAVMAPACSSLGVRCPSTAGLCVPQSRICDGKKDCPDGFDEKFCVKACPSKTDFLCRDRRSCVSHTKVCDGRSHCLDGSDEEKCPSVAPGAPQEDRVRCRLGSRLCADGTECVLNTHICDGQRDCGDGSDEDGCGLLKTVGPALLSPAHLNDSPTPVEPVRDPPTKPPSCTSPSAQCPGSSVCLKPSQLCDGRTDCPDGSDETQCVQRCPYNTDFLCRDRRSCVSHTKVCDGRSHCLDGSDEEKCPSVAPGAPQEDRVRCRLGSRLCADGTECVLNTHICDGQRDCRDGSDEDGCDAETPSVRLSKGPPTPVEPVRDPPTKPPSCTSPSAQCPGSSVCLKPSQLCDGRTDCPDGSDETQCVQRCPYNTDFLCRDRRSCVSHTKVCDGRSHCLDGSDEEKCPSVAPGAPQEDRVRCRLGSRLCADGTECVLNTHICDGQRDCGDGSDEDGCGLLKTVGPALLSPAHLNDSPTPVEPVRDPPTKPPSCTSPSAQCPGSSVCLKPSQLCDGRTDCPDGSDETQCVQRCPYNTDFLCRDRRSCVSHTKVCDGRSHCLDGSDEEKCPSVAPGAPQEDRVRCRLGSRLCADGTECVLNTHICDGQRDCGDGSDEDGCEPTVATPSTSCRSPSVQCPGSSVCLKPSQLCDGRTDCPDGSDEKCVRKCPNTDFLCKDNRGCVSRRLVCDGRLHCQDGSDELSCPGVVSPAAQPFVLKCRTGSKPCADGKECVLYSHLCDGEADCLDGSDEKGCQTSCKLGEFQCAHGRKCIPEAQVCDGRAQCGDGSDEAGCWDATRSCEHRCADGKRCIPKKFLCDGERDCLDGTDEMNCNSIPPRPTVTTDGQRAPACDPPSVLCPGSALCVPPEKLCDGRRQCPDGFDEESCVFKCENQDDFLCSDHRKCIASKEVCDGRAQCADRSDEKRCPQEPKASASKTPLICRRGFKPCKDGRQCVMYSHVCDGETDCRDGSDEEGCAAKCRDGEFQCSHGKKCIPREQVCNGQRECQDGSDELDCSSLVDGCHHRCDNGTRCVPQTFLCDGETDCADGSDEAKCGLVRCPPDQYRCASGQCVSEAMRCDGYVDCADRSDEAGCPRPPRCPPQLRCPHSHECLQKEWLCDGEDDCQDGSDEKNCVAPPAKCRVYQWQCGGSSQCIPLSWRCDGKEDCANGEDENKCNKRKCPPHLFRCGSGECVDPRLVCNRFTNCIDGTDEGAGCAKYNCSSPKAPRCDHQCVGTPDGPVCFCKAGFTLQFNGLSCMDVDECSAAPHAAPHAACKHLCLNSQGSFSCHCHPGFYLEPDNRSCKTKDEPLLLASVQSELLQLGVHSGALRLLSAVNRPVFSLDYDWAQQRVYWLSPHYQSIRWAEMKNPNTKRTLIKGVKSDYLAVDWVGRNLYWVDGLVGQILAIKLSDLTLKSQDFTVVLEEDLEQPSSLSLLPHKGLMLWSEIGSRPQIELSGMDGSKRKVLVSRDLSWPVSLSYDLLDNRVYWADEKLRCIGSASLDGDDVRILQLAETPNPFSVAVFNDRVFWSDTKRRTIRSADKNTGKDQKVLLKRPGQPFGLKLMHSISQPSIASPCENLQCSHLCLLAPAEKGQSVQGPSAVCRCPKGLLLSGDRRTCSLPVDSSFVLLVSPHTVYQIYLRSLRRDGVSLKKMPSSRALSLPRTNEAVTLDVSMRDMSLFLAYSGRPSVDVLRLSSSRSRQGLTLAAQMLQLKDDYVTALAVDWVTSNLYWSSNRRPDIFVTSRSSQHNTSLLQGSAPVKGITSIALHPPSGRLCYSTIFRAGGKGQAEVDCAGMDGRNKAVLWRKSSIPTSVVLANNGTRVYWADAGEGSIGSIGIDGSGYKRIQTGSGLLVSFTHTSNLLLWVTLGKDVSRVWFSDGLQPKQLWFETKTSVAEIKAFSNDTQSGNNSCSISNGGCEHLCLPHPGGRTCRCGRGFYSTNATSCAALPPCPAGQTSCLGTKKCISSSKFCDGRTDCPDQSDEQDCVFTLSASSGSKGSDAPAAPAAPPAPPAPRPSSKADGSPAPPDEAHGCGLRRCSGHGHCVIEGGVTHCQCLHGYSGDACQEAASEQSHGALIFGVFLLVAAVITAMFIFSRRRLWAGLRRRAADKENLMANMGLASESSEDEEVESAADVKIPSLPLEPLE